MSTALISIIIFFITICLYLWNKFPISIPALVGLILMLLFNVLPFEDAFTNFGSETVILICSMMVVGKAAFKTGLAQYLGKKVISIAGTKERVVITLATALTAIISSFLSNVATLAMMISIVTGICEGNKNIKFKNIIMPLGVASTLGGIVTLVGSTPQLLAQSFIKKHLNKSFHFFTFITPGIIIIILLVLYVWFIGYPLGKKIWKEDKSKIDSKVKDTNINNKKIGLMAIIFVVTIILYISCDFLKTFIPNLNIGIIALTSALVCVLTGCISHKDAIKSINWTTALWFCASLGIAEGLSSSGGGELLANSFIGLFGSNVSPIVLFIALSILTISLTQFLSNTTVISLILPIAFPIIDKMGYNSYSFAVGLTIMCAMAVMTPIANTTIGMTMIADYKFSDYIKYCAPLVIILMIVLIFLIPVLWPLA